MRNPNSRTQQFKNSLQVQDFFLEGNFKYYYVATLDHVIFFREPTEKVRGPKGAIVSIITSKDSYNIFSTLRKMKELISISLKRN